MAHPIDSTIADGCPASIANLGDADRKSLRFAFLTNFIPPYWNPVLHCLSQCYGRMRVLVSTPMESDRRWKIDWEGLDVVAQRTFTVQARQRHPKGFCDRVFIHFPIDTVSQLRKFRPDVVLTAEMGFRSWMAAIYRKLCPRSKLILYADVSEYSELGRSFGRTVLRRILRRSVDAFIVPGESGARYVRTLGAAAHDIFKVPYAAEVDRFGTCAVKRTDEIARRLLYVGRLIERKGLVPFITSLSRWASANPHRSVELVIAGDGPLRAQLQGVNVPATLLVTFLEELDYDAVPEVYARSGIFIFPTLADTWGLAVNEAMAAGLPVLGSIYSQAVQELVQDGQNGWVFRPDDRDETYRAIDRAMNTPIETLSEMRECARSTAMRLTPRHVADLLDGIVRNVVKVS